MSDPNAPPLPPPPRPPEEEPAVFNGLTVPTRKESLAALIIGFIVGMIASTLTIILTAGLSIFPIIVIPLVFTCFFEVGTAAIIGNGTGGIRGCIIGTAASAIVMVFLVGFGAYFFEGTINGWMLVFGGNDFSLWGIIMGAISRIFA